jgi:hypothetical protein
MTAPLHIAVLEDNASRRAAMEASLRERFHQYQPQLFVSASSLIGFLQEHLAEVIVVCLDHDLELQPGRDGRLTDPGTGRQVADYLADQPPTCPVVVHSTNSAAAVGMVALLEENGWRVYRVVPYGDIEWIPREWLRTVRRAILDTAESTKLKAARK